MTTLRGTALAAALTIAVATGAPGQSRDIPAFAGGAVLLGAQGFARPPITSAVTSAYVHLPIGPVLFGLQGASTFLEPRRSHASYAVATIAYAQRRGTRWQVYPYVGVGSAAFRTNPGDERWRLAGAAGFGFDGLLGGGATGTMLGARFGYLTRSLSDDESVAYAAIGIGFGGRRFAQGR